MAGSIDRHSFDRSRRGGADFLGRVPALGVARSRSRRQRLCSRLACLSDVQVLMLDYELEPCDGRDTGYRPGILALGLGLTLPEEDSYSSLRLKGSSCSGGPFTMLGRWF